MINLTVSQLWSLVPVLRGLMLVNMPLKVALKIARIVARAEAKVKEVEEKRRVLIKELGVEKDGQMSVPEEKREEFVQRFEKIIPATFTVEAAALTVAEMESVQLSPQDALVLDQCGVLVE